MKSSAARKGEPSSLLDEDGNAIVSEPLESRVARIESGVEHVKTNTENLVVELRRTNDRIDATWHRIEGARELLATKSDGVRQELGEKIDGVREELGERIERVDKKVDGVREGLSEKIDKLREDLSAARIWAVLLYLTLAAGLLSVIARAFKWV
jgi:chromosome segregation ATPase